jgi:hypothetical protein
MPTEKPLVLGRLEIAGYTWTVLDHSETAARKCLLEEYEKYRADNPGHPYLPDEPFEYFSCSFTPMTIGRLAWL